MANVVNTLYPPVVNSFMRAFVFTTDAKIYFSLSSYNSSTDIKRVHVSVVNQLNNENALDPFYNKNGMGVLLTDMEYDTVAGMYYITIPVKAIKGGAWNINQFYKIQLRFDNCDWNGLPLEERPDTPAKISDYLLTKTEHFSEWSTVCLIRPILQPNMRIKVFDNFYVEAGDSDIIAFNKGIVPIVGGMYFGDGSANNETETMASYKISILNKQSKKVVKEYPTIYTGNQLNPNNINTQIELQGLNIDEGVEFIFKLSATTSNNYILNIEYPFQIAEFLDDGTFSPKIAVEVNDDRATATIHVTNVQTVFGTIYIKRASSQDDFREYESIYTEHCAGPIDITFTDNTVGSLIWYKYSVQFENTAGALTPVYYSQVIMPKFYDAIISRGDKQLCIKYDYNVSSYKPIVNRAKIDTLGGKYPKFAENAILNYKQFAITGLIAAESDVYQDFLSKRKFFKGERQSYYDKYKDDEHIKDLVRNDVQDYEKPSNNPYPQGSMPENTVDNFITTTQDDWLWEREFREALVKWLNDGNPKLYRSMAEGNLVVMLTDINLTPKQGTSRFIWTFTANLYEVASAEKLETLDTLGIYEIHKLTGSGEDNGPIVPPKDYIEVVTVGQLYNFQITNKNDIRNMIKDQLQQKYGRRNNQDDIWDKGNILSDKKPDDIYLKNVKIFFNNKPNLYWIDSTGRMNQIRDNQYNPAEDAGKTIVRGYVFELKTSAAKDSATQIFVNERGYYQIPADLDVVELTFPRIGDNVTLEYMLTFNEHNRIENTVAGSSVAKTIIGQEDGIFKPKTWYGERIRRKYNFIEPGKYQEYMKFWKGICIDTIPFAVCEIQYKGDQNAKPYMVGETGVLHMLQDVPVADIRFLGRKMTEKPLSRQKFLGMWEYCLDPSVSNTDLVNNLHWFTIQGIEENDKKVDIYEDENRADGIYTGFYHMPNPTKPSTDTPYTTTNDVKHPQYNTVYNINGEMKIYARDSHWYDFERLPLDETDIMANTSDEKVGMACIPIEGQINYFGQVLRSKFA